ncbi:acetoin utilization AcuB family protein [Fictibacillus enclensis]|uniref:acetoin utilization AcuB family protein n=1 Tax=Fictibacillus enclensis TaxID=1017270 RepID=UPI0025A30410|nr:acetoin utilization AcuB family protein [Fictibacillus enclensis]MDM5200100.1 acetoin utilization AcuB family protein [Fictibacillus enclensis]
MIVQDMMNKKPVTARPETTIVEALLTLKKHRIRHLPIIVEDGSLAGIISDRDLRDASPSIFDAADHADKLERPISEIMVRDVITAHPLDFAEDLLSVFYEHQIGCIPVLEHEKLVGVITERDMLYTLIQLTGAHQPSSHLEVKVENIAGQLADVASLIKKFKININSVLVYPNKQDDSQKILVLRIGTMNPYRIASELRQNGYDVIWPQEPEVGQ